MHDTSFLVDVLTRLVAFPTVSGKPLDALIGYLSGFFEDKGFSLQLLPDSGDPKKSNLICRAGPHKEGGLIISGHMDVVPTEGQPWTSDPFKLLNKDGRLYGRGSSDMKGFIACSVAFLKRLDPAKLKEPLVFIWTMEEEVGCKGSAQLVRYLQEHPQTLPKQAWVGEPTDFQIFRMHPGHVAIKLVTGGVAAHSSKPDLGKSAIKAMLHITDVIGTLESDLQKERRFEDDLDRPFVTTNIGQIRGGHAVNIVPDSCELIFGYRPLPGDDPLAVYKRLEERIRARAETEHFLWSSEIVSLTRALNSPKGLSLEKAMQPHAHPQGRHAASFATDGGNLAQLGVDSLIFGPGSIDVAHKADEYVDLAALSQAVDIMERIVSG